jgi:hypothetical protein
LRSAVVFFMVLSRIETLQGFPYLGVRTEEKSR